MEKKDYYDQCEKCGRPFPKAKPCECKFWDGCTTEYRHKAKGCIRNKNPECPYNAVIASVTVENVDGITNLADCLVHVTSINTTYYIDDKHRIMIIWAGPVEVADYDYTTNPLGLRAQDCYTTIGADYVKIHYDAQGNAHIFKSEEVTL